jgi:EpsI family protein
MIPLFAKYLPAVVLAAGAGMSALIGSPQPTPLRRPLAATLPATFLGVPGTDVTIAPSEVEGSGVSDYLNRVYMLGKDESAQLYVGYHATQTGDKYMHSPSVCLPGSGWTPVSDKVVPIRFGNATANVNRYVLRNGSNTILVYYWFQGRGRLMAGPGELKMKTLKDGLLSHRDEEALVRVIVPLNPQVATVASTGLSPDSVAVRLAEAAVPALNLALPAAP